MQQLMIPLLLWTLWGQMTLQECTPLGCASVPQELHTPVPRRYAHFATYEECRDVADHLWHGRAALNIEVQQQARAMSPEFWLEQAHRFWCAAEEGQA